MHPSPHPLTIKTSNSSPGTPSPLHHWSEYNAAQDQVDVKTPLPAASRLRDGTQWKRSMQAFFEDPTSSRAASVFHLTQSILILISAICLCISTMHVLKDEEMLFFFIEAVLSVLFTMEWLCRYVVSLLDVGEKPKRRDDLSEGLGSLLGEEDFGDVDLGDSLKVERVLPNRSDSQERLDEVHIDPSQSYQLQANEAHTLQSTSSNRTFTRKPIRATLRFLFNWWNIIDLGAFLPFWIDSILYLFTGVQLYVEHLAIFRILRLIRIFRIFHFGVRVNLLLRAIRMNLNLLFSVFCMSAMSIVIFATLIYFAEHSEQPEAFSSVPAALFFVMVSFTTTGYGDYVPKTAAGKFVTAIIIGIGCVALTLPGLIVSNTFASLSHQYDVDRRNRRRLKRERREAARLRKRDISGKSPLIDRRHRGAGTGDAPLSAVFESDTILNSQSASSQLQSSTGSRATDNSTYKFASKSQLIALLREKDAVMQNQLKVMQHSMKEITDLRQLLRSVMESMEVP